MKQPKIILMLALLLSAEIATCQQSFFATCNAITPNINLIGTSAVPCSDGGMLVSGYIQRDTAVLNVYNLLFIKFDSTGNIVWNKTYESIKSMSSGCLVADGNNFIFSGTMGNDSLLLMKLDSVGDTIWVKGYSDAGGNTGSLHNLGNGKFISTGGYNNMYNYISVKQFDSSGNLLWNRNYRYSPTIGIGTCNGIICSDGGVLIYNTNSILIKLDSLGTVQWSTPRCTTANGSFNASDVVEMSNGDFLLSGFFSVSGGVNRAGAIRFSSTGLMLSVNQLGSPTVNSHFYRARTFPDGITRLLGYATPVGNTSCLLIVGIDTAMNVVSSTYNCDIGGNSLIPIGFGVDNNGGYYSAGYTLDYSGPDFNLFVLRNTPVTAGCGVSPGPMTITNIIPTNLQTGQIIEAISSPVVINVPLTQGQNAIMIDGFCLASGIDESEVGLTSNFEVYPNPLTGQVVTIDLKNMNHSASLSISNSLGQQVLSTRLEQSSTQIDLSGLSAGIYFINVYFESGTVSKKLIVPIEK